QKTSPFPAQFEGAEAEWKKILLQHGFTDVDKALRVLREFVEGPGYVHVSPRTRGLAYELLPRLFERCPQTGTHAKDRTSEVQSLGSKSSNPKSPASTLKSRPIGLKPYGETLLLSDPDRVVTRLDNFISAYGARATLFELWN